MSALRLALRSLLKAPGFTAIALVTLALGIGLNTSMFSVVNAMLYRPLPYPDAANLVRLYGTSLQSQTWAFTVPYAEELRAQPSPFVRTGAFAFWSATLTEPGKPAEHLMALRVSHDFLPTLGVPPLHGRWFTPEEDTPGSNVAILPHGTWLHHFAGDPDIVGRTIRLDATAYTIVGVMPKEFDAPLVFGPVGIMRPLAVQPHERTDRQQRSVNLIGRLSPDMSARQATTVLRTQAANLAAQHPREHGQDSMRLVPLHASNTDGTGAMITWLVLGLSGFVLLIACANLANLQLVRATARVRELAVRAALGATRWKLMRPLLLESLLLAVLGGAAGLLIAVWCNAWISSRIVLFEGATFAIPLDGRVLLFAVVVALFTGVLFGTAPGLLAARVRVNDALKSQSRGATAGRGQNALRQVLVAGEFTLAVVLLAGAGFFFTGIRGFLDRDPGWNTHHLAFGSVALPAARYTDPEKTHTFYKNVRDHLLNQPGVESVAVGWSLPMFFYLSTRPITVEGAPASPGQPAPLAFFNGIMPGYLQTLEIALREGRDFSDRDDLTTPPVAIINETMARTFWPNESAVGKRVGGADPANPHWIEIVGVVRDVQFASNMNPPATPFQIYRPFAQEAWGYAGIAVRSRAPAATMIDPLCRAVSHVDPDVAVDDPTTVRDTVNRIVANFALTVRLLTGIAALGLFLAALGIYGVLAQVVEQRTPELGVRLALGASSRDVMRLVLGMGLRVALCGLAVGVVGAVLFGHGLTAAMPLLRSPTLVVTALVTLTLLLAALVACWLPARRATRIDPVVALRAD